MPRPIEFEFVSSLDATPQEVWRSVSTMRGVNHELHPFVHMTSARDHRVLPTTVVAGQTVFASWLLLFGVLPFDRHALAFERVEDGRGFVEESTSWLQRRWRHERWLTAVGDRGCTIVDRLVIEPRLRLGWSLVSLIVSQLFGHRHRRLERRFGGLLSD